MLAEGAGKNSMAKPLGKLHEEKVFKDPVHRYIHVRDELIWRLIGRDSLAIRRQHWPGWSPYPARYRDKDHFTRMY